MLEHVLADVADTISRTGSLIFRDTSAGVVFCPEHAQLLADAGYAKADVQAWLMEHCGRTGADLRRAGKNGLRGIARFADADTSGDDTFTRILPSPRHVPIVVAGARNAAIKCARSSWRTPMRRRRSRNICPITRQRRKSTPRCWKICSAT